jgi:hypothetical protein
MPEKQAARANNVHNEHAILFGILRDGPRATKIFTHQTPMNLAPEMLRPQSRNLQLRHYRPTGLIIA